MYYSKKDHTFVVCAYGESIYLEECIKSVMNQTVKSQVIMTTSTVNSYIRFLAEKYGIRLIVNKKRNAGIVEDWNFAYECAETKLVTICHQDDIYCEEYVEWLLKKCNRGSDILIFFSNYFELRNKERVDKNQLLFVKRILLCPLKIHIFSKMRWLRRRILSVGSPICCPAVTFNKERISNPIFTDEYKSILDCDAWEKISKMKGEFIYCDKILMGHRIHEESLTSEVIRNHVRDSEEFEMFQKFWPKKLAKFIWQIYKRSSESNSIK